MIRPFCPKSIVGTTSFGGKARVHFGVGAEILARPRLKC